MQEMGRHVSKISSPHNALFQIFCTHEDLHGEEIHHYGGLEFPQINYGKYNTRPYRFFYGCGFRHLVGDSLIKMDLQGKHMKVSMYINIGGGRGSNFDSAHIVVCSLVRDT